MVIDSIENREIYFNLGSGIERALRYLAVTDFSTIEPGKYEIDEDEIFVIVDEYAPRNETECHLEAHKRYVDVQFVAYGDERVGWAPLSDQAVVEAYSEKTDLAFFDGEEQYVELKEGRFAIFFPTDLHKPGLKLEANAVKKVVVKIALTHLK